MRLNFSAECSDRSFEFDDSADDFDVNANQSAHNPDQIKEGNHDSGNVEFNGRHYDIP